MGFGARIPPKFEVGQPGSGPQVSLCAPPSGKGLPWDGRREPGLPARLADLWPLETRRKGTVVWNPPVTDSSPAGLGRKPRQQDRETVVTQLRAPVPLDRGLDRCPGLVCLSAVCLPSVLVTPFQGGKRSGRSLCVPQVSHDFAINFDPEDDRCEGRSPGAWGRAAVSPAHHLPPPNRQASRAWWRPTSAACPGSSSTAPPMWLPSSPRWPAWRRPRSTPVRPR